MSSFLHGIGTVQFIDKSGELLDLKGLSIDSLEKTGVINYEHKSDFPGQLVGKILKAKKIFSEKDCANEHELYFWKKTKAPYLYIMAELLDDYCDSAKHVAGILRYDRDRKGKNSHNIMWFSIEGSEIPNTRVGKSVITRGIARKVTLTSAPCNAAAAVEILENQEPKIKDDFDEIFKSEQEAVLLFKNGEGVKIYETYLEKKEAEGPSIGGKAPKNPYNEYENAGIRAGKTKSGKNVWSHGQAENYGFNPAEHQESNEHHHHASVIADNPKLSDNREGRMKTNSNAVKAGGRKENRSALSLNQKDKIAQEQGKQVSKSEYCEKHKKLQKGEKAKWSGPKVTADAVHYSHPEHNIVSIHKQPNGEFHVKHNGRVAGVGGKKGIFSNAKDAGEHAKSFMSGLSNGTVSAPAMQNHPSPNIIGTSIKKAVEAGSYNAAPSTLTNGAAYQTESMSKKQAPSEDHNFKGSKEKDWNLRAKQDYEKWPHKDKFEKFMKSRMPHLSMGEIQAFGRVVALKKNLEFENSLSELVGINKSIDLDKGNKDIKEKSLAEIQKDTAYTWASRALASYKTLENTGLWEWNHDAEEYAHEALEHAALIGETHPHVLPEIQELISNAKRVAIEKAQTISKGFSVEHAKIVFRKDSHNKPGEWERFKKEHPTHVVIEHQEGGDLGYIVCHESEIDKWLKRCKDHKIDVDHIYFQGEKYSKDESEEINADFEDFNEKEHKEHLKEMKDGSEKPKDGTEIKKISKMLGKL